MNHQDVSQSRSYFLIVLVATLAGLCLRLLISLYSIGSNDAVNWFYSVNTVSSVGLIDAYLHDKYMNNPPLITIANQGLLFLSKYFDLSFPFLLRLPGILAECGTGFVLYFFWKGLGNERGGAAAGCLYAFSPFSVMYTGFNGNIDGLCIFLTCAAIYTTLVKKHTLVGGVLLGLALNVKLIPMLLIPGIIFQIKDKRDIISFMLGGTLSMLPFLVAYILIGHALYERVFGYRSILDYWGPQLFLMISYSNFQEYRSVIAVVIEKYHSWGPFVILGAVTVCSWLCRNKWNNPFIIPAVSYLLFGIIASGFGLSYLTHFIPLLMAVSVSKAMYLSVLAGAVQLYVYGYFLASSHIPYQTIHIGTSPKPAVLGMFLLWILLIVYFFEFIKMHCIPEISNRENTLVA